MILRRLSKHIKEQNWFAVVLDFLIVVLGVFMALQVQEWAAHRAKAGETQEYFTRLGKEYTELSIAQREASNKYDIYYRNGINFIALLVNSENNDKRDGDDKDDNATLSTLVGETFYVVIPQQIPAVLQEMISAGNKVVDGFWEECRLVPCLACNMVRHLIFSLVWLTINYTKLGFKIGAPAKTV
ncbi:hypothetical protein [Brumicola pallidula]|uniref:Uncharacterized protein n=1 Tax=Brumicola pallidula DSM 14239 = ACAM 615 TaxID=1121922 RepID=K6Y3G1_9ALTE|nr:hypothetical protein [Glaciecola pallidula]GAC27314.1 hypothetical protein GPAL_0434 [Glaciecola pallidula DSM 14239 = ACAM 615]